MSTTTTSGVKVFSPGERVPDTGIYKSTHSNRHAVSNESVFEGGKKFPLCGVCFWSVRYAMVADCTPEDMVAFRHKIKQ